MYSLEIIKKKEMIKAEEEKAKIIEYLTAVSNKEKLAQEKSVNELKESCKQIIEQIFKLKSKIS